MTETGRFGEPDGNVDLVLTRGSARRIVQCKRWTSAHVGVGEIRMFLGTLSREGLGGSAGVFVTLSRFSKEALSEAADANLELDLLGDLSQEIRSQ